MSIAASDLRRFEAGSFFGVPSVRDRETDEVIVHQAPWTEDMATFVAAELNARRSRAAHFKWESRSSWGLAG